MQLITLTDKTNRTPWAWTETNRKRADDLLEVFNQMRDYWELTARQAYYRLISSDRYNQAHWYKFNDPARGRLGDTYQSILSLLKWMRIHEILPWEALTDDHRINSGKVGFENPQQFIKQEVDNFLCGYTRCRAHRQSNYIEVWIEKAALYHIVKPITDKFCRRLICCRGYNSITFQSDFYTRATDAIMQGKKPVVLYFGDFDPSGVDMLNAAVQTLTDELGLVGVDYYRCGINPDQFHLINANPIPIKASDTRAKKFIEQHGHIAYELDAFHPVQLQQIVRKSIEAMTDMDVMNEDRSMEIEDYDLLEGIKERVYDAIYME